MKILKKQNAELQQELYAYKLLFTNICEIPENEAWVHFNQLRRVDVMTAMPSLPHDRLAPANLSTWRSTGYGASPENGTSNVRSVHSVQGVQGVVGNSFGSMFLSDGTMMTDFNRDLWLPLWGNSSLVGPYLTAPSDSTAAQQLPD